VLNDLRLLKVSSIGESRLISGELKDIEMAVRSLRDNGRLNEVFQDFQGEYACCQS